MQTIYLATNEFFIALVNISKLLKKFVANKNLFTVYQYR